MYKAEHCATKSRSFDYKIILHFLTHSNALRSSPTLTSPFQIVLGRTAISGEQLLEPAIANVYDTVPTRPNRASDQRASARVTIRCRTRPKLLCVISAEVEASSLNAMSIFGSHGKRTFMRRSRQSPVYACRNS